MAVAAIKHFAVCNGVTIELLNPWYSDLKRDFERLIGRPKREGEKLVRNCQLFAFGVCPNCGENHPTERVIQYAKNPRPAQVRGAVHGSQRTTVRVLL